MPGQQAVFAEIGGWYCAAPEALFRHESQAEVAPGGSAHSSHGNSGDLDHAGIGRGLLAAEQLDQFGLAIAGYPGDAENFAACHRERDVEQAHAEWTIGRDAKLPDFERGLS